MRENASSHIFTATESGDSAGDRTRVTRVESHFYRYTLQCSIFIFFLTILQKTGYAHLRAKVHFFFFHLLFLKTNEQAKQLRAHGKPWMQRVPYTFPLHKLPPELRFSLKGFFLFLFAFLI